MVPPLKKSCYAGLFRGTSARKGGIKILFKVRAFTGFCSYRTLSNKEGWRLFTSTLKEGINLCALASNPWSIVLFQTLPASQKYRRWLDIKHKCQDYWERNETQNVGGLSQYLFNFVFYGVLGRFFQIPTSSVTTPSNALSSPPALIFLSDILKNFSKF